MKKLTIILLLLTFGVTTVAQKAYRFRTVSVKNVFKHYNEWPSWDSVDAIEVNAVVSIKFNKAGAMETIKIYTEKTQVYTIVKVDIPEETDEYIKGLYYGENKQGKSCSIRVAIYNNPDKYYQQL